MNSVIKPWESGGNLSITYDGDGDGSAVFSSDVNTGEERVMEVSFVDASRNVIVVRTVRQAAGQTTNETYTRLTYVECDGKQYIDLGYVVKEDDVIEANFILTKIAVADSFLVGTADANAGLWFEFYANNAYVRFGASASKSISSSSGKYSMRLEKGKVTIGTTETALEYEQMPNNTINLFAGKLSSGAPYNYGYYRCNKFRISDSNGLVMDLIPAKRDSDGAIGMVDIVSGKFYTSAEEEFIAGSEARVTDDYEIIDYVTFAKNKLYDIGIVSNTDTLEVLFQRNESSTTPYLYGCITSPHTASVTAYLSSGGAWRFGSSYKGISTNSLNEFRMQVSNGKVVYNNTSGTFTKSTFTTPNTVVLGGYRAASGSLTKNYQGKVFYFRIYNNGELRLDWLPCRRKSDEVEGFWDCVTQTFVEPII